MGRGDLARRPARLGRAGLTTPGAATSRCASDLDALERLGVAEAGLLADVAVALADPLLDVPLHAGLRYLTLVLLQRRELEVERLRNVDEVVAHHPERDPDLVDDVRRVALL